MLPWDDLTEFVDEDDFAVPVVVTQDGSVWSFSGIFDAPFLAAQAGGYDMDSATITVTAIETAMAGIRRKAVCVVNGAAYAVMNAPKADGTGMAVLMLSVQP
ncbi:hypothetical protein PO883_15035 [Massilia sp. DJPM01]|uniref:head-tail joining protein n=1 Tax=Massilia sp. DJPM01 TaxID=3024404 RepID=UPI00259EAB53|nr:hypothetical protein [Massilia sp. DJPM01]MDM5178511.1 hypothetical protein [Massilia sp. DJPM01]